MTINMPNKVRTWRCIFSTAETYLLSKLNIFGTFIAHHFSYIFTTTLDTFGNQDTMHATKVPFQLHHKVLVVNILSTLLFWLFLLSILFKFERLRLKPLKNSSNYKVSLHQKPSSKYLKISS